MKFSFRILSRRRLLMVLAVATCLFGLAMLHPYPRQSLFGPTIRGKPWCVWEDALRQQFNERPETWIDRVRRGLGVKREQITLEDFDDPDMLPLVVALLDDPDAQTRSICMTAITTFPSLQGQAALPALRKRLNDDEMELRHAAARAIWQIGKDKEVLSVLLKLLDDDDPRTRLLAMGDIANISADVPELYPHIVAHAKDSDARVRRQVMYAMMYFGKKGVPILIDGLNDADGSVRYAAVHVAQLIGPDARDAIPDIEARLKDADAGVAYFARLALRAIDPKRFHHLKAEQKKE